jgi:hypothetical protein
MAKTKENAETLSQPEPVEDNGIGHVPDPPFAGEYRLDVGVDFANAEGGETHIDAGVINGTDLPLDVAQSLADRGLLIKA